MKNLSLKFKAIYRIVFILLICLYQVNAQTFKSKNGGVCFRFDDYQSVANLDKVRNVFNKHGVKFTYALNSSIGELMGDESYWTMLKTIAADGHELADQSPSDVSHYIDIATSSEALSYSGRSGVDHVNSTAKRVCLKYTLLNSNGSGDEGKIDIKGNMIISKTAGEFAFSKLINLRYTTHFFIPALNKLVTFTDLRNANPNDVDTAYVKSFWKEDIDLGTLNNTDYKKITPYEMTIDKEGIQIMAEHSLKVFARHNVILPVTFIHPGGAHPYITPKNLKAALTPMGYQGGGSYPVVINAITDYNPQGEKQFSLQGGNFTPEFSSVPEMKTSIANLIAKNVVLVSINHFTALGAIYSFDQMLVNLEAIIVWCKANGIKIDTYKNWNTYLTSDFYDQTDDVFPPLQNDFNADNIPDGLNMANPGFLDKINGTAYSNSVCFKVSTVGNVFNINDLAGLSRGKNTFYMSTRGGANIYDYFNVVIDMPEKGLTRTFNVMANSAPYTERSFDVEVPYGVTYVNVSVNYQTDKAQVAFLSGIKIKSAAKPSAKLQSIERKQNEAFAPISLLGNGACNGYTQAQLIWSILKKPVYLNAAISANNVLQLNPLSNKFWVGTDSMQLRVATTDNKADTAWLFIRSFPAKTCKGQYTDISMNADTSDKSYSWGAAPADVTLINASSTIVRVNPTQNTTYTVTVTNKNNSTTAHALLLNLLDSKITSGPYETKHFNGANSVSFTLNYPAYYSVNMYQIPQAALTVGISGKTVTLTRSPTFTGNLEAKLFVTTPACDATIHTLIGTTFGVGIKDDIEKQSPVVFPNPFSDIIYIKNWQSGSGVIEIFDLNGQLLKSMQVLSEHPEIQVAELKPGFYVLRFTQGEAIYITKIIK